MMNTPTIVVQDKPIIFGEGLYFGLPDEYYHAIPALSSTGFKNLNVSAPDFYANCPWLNPYYADDKEDEDSTEWQKFGHASHTRILEGRRVFNERYCVEFLAPEGCLKTTDDLVRYLTENGVIAEKKIDPNAVTKSSSKPELMAAVTRHDDQAIETLGLKTNPQLVDYLVKAGIIVEKKPDPDAVTKSSPKDALIRAALKHNPHVMIYDYEEAKYFRETQGRIQLAERDIRRIETAAAYVEHHTEIRNWLPGGCAEVTVIWKEQFTHPQSGKRVTLWFKVRFDSLKPAYNATGKGYVGDLKTFRNMRNKPIEKAIYEATGSMKYHIQVFHYLRGAQFAVEFAKRGITASFSSVSAPPPDFLANLAKTTDFGFRFIFQKKGGAPLIRGMNFSPKLGMYGTARASVEQALNLFMIYYSTYGRELWLDNTPVQEFVDEGFPVYASEL